jgi:hypothetical protein
MTYGRVCFAGRRRDVEGAAVSHLAELARGYFLPPDGGGPLIRPFGPPSPQGEKGHRGPLWSTIATVRILRN